MPIRSHLKALLIKKAKDGQLNIRQVERDTGLAFTTIKRFMDGPDRFDTATLDKLCELLDCQPGDLLTYDKPGTDQPGE